MVNDVTYFLIPKIDYCDQIFFYYDFLYILKNFDFNSKKH